MLGHLKQQGITILVSTPYMDEASMCDRVALIQSGKILQVDTPQGITHAFRHTIIAAKAPNMLQLLNQLKQMPQVADAYAFGEYHHAVLKDGVTALPEMEGVATKQVQADIEDCFIALM